MKGLAYSLPLAAMTVLIFVSVAVAQTSLDPSIPDQYGADPYSMDQYGTDQYGVDQYDATPNVEMVSRRQVSVNIQPVGFRLANLPIEPGTTVKWINMDTKPHTVTADDGSFDSGVLQPRQSFSFTFDEPGRWGYYDALDPSMTGSVIVREEGAATPEDPAGDPAQTDNGSV